MTTATTTPGTNEYILSAAQEVMERQQADARREAFARMRKGIAGTLSTVAVQMATNAMLHPDPAFMAREYPKWMSVVAMLPLYESGAIELESINDLIDGETK